MNKYKILPDGTMELNPTYTEILRLDKMLDEKKIEHEIIRFWDGYRIGIIYNGREIGDIVQHYGSYGNTDNLLETMGFDKTDVIGSLTAEQAMELIKLAIKRRMNKCTTE